MSLRIGLVGAVQSTERALRALAACGAPPALLLTLPPSKGARHSDYVDLAPVAGQLGVEVAHVGDVNDPALLERLSGMQLDLILVIGWSRICGPEFIAVSRLGAIGYHPTLLPKMRGRAALGWTIVLDVRETGGTLFWIDEGVDSGDIAAQQRVPLTGSETLSQLMALQLDALEAMLRTLVAQLLAGERPARKQDHGQATYLALRRPQDSEIDWHTPAAEIERLVRAVSQPYPGAFTFLGDKRLTIWSARIVSFPQWHALIGQVFTLDGGAPVVRCGSGTDLMLLDFELEDAASDAEKTKALRGQPRLGRR